jgi:hypothetical protein
MIAPRKLPIGWKIKGFSTNTENEQYNIMLCISNPYSLFSTGTTDHDAFKLQKLLSFSLIVDIFFLSNTHSWYFHKNKQ